MEGKEVAASDVKQEPGNRRPECPDKAASATPALSSKCCRLIAAETDFYPVICFVEIAPFLSY